MYEKIAELIDEELEKRVNEIINEFATKISRKHAIPLEHLLKDIPDTFKVTVCKGTKANGHRCTTKALSGGYCGFHITQSMRLRPPPPSSNLHNHGPEKLFVKGCPGCIDTEGLIEMGI